jgi:hypothetical protein
MAATMASPTLAAWRTTATSSALNGIISRDSGWATGVNCASGNFSSSVFHSRSPTLEERGKAISLLP